MDFETIYQTSDLFDSQTICFQRQRIFIRFELKKKKEKGLFVVTKVSETYHRYRRLRVKFFNTYYIHACF